MRAAFLNPPPGAGAAEVLETARVMLQIAEELENGGCSADGKNARTAKNPRKKTSHKR